MSRVSQISLRILVLFPMFCSCQNVKNKSVFLNSDMYDLANPKVLKLAPELDEISGLAYYSKDTSVFAIIDEDGILYKIPLNHPDQFREWTFDKKRDYEDVVLRDSVFYVLVSNGDIVTIHFNGDKPTAFKTEFPGASKKINEFEALYNDAGKIIIVCKSCEADEAGIASSYLYNPLDSVNVYSNYKQFDLLSVLDEKERKGKHAKISAAAIHPVTGELYLLSSIHHLLVIADKNGRVRKSFKLDPSLYNQAEGIAFTPTGDLVISNEKGATANATLLLMKNKLNKQ